MDIEDKIELMDVELREIKGDVAQIHTIVMGPPPARNNGLRGDLKIVQEQQSRWNEEVWQNKRREDCIGMAEAAKIWTAVKTLQEGEATMKVAKLNLRGVYAMGVLQFIGMVIVALIAAGVV